MEKKLFGAAMAVMMLVIILSVSIPTVNAAVKKTQPRVGTLQVYVLDAQNQTISYANVTATSYDTGLVYMIPFNNATYQRTLPPGAYKVDVFVRNQWQSQNTNISSGQYITLVFIFNLPTLFSL